MSLDLSMPLTQKAFEFAKRAHESVNHRRKYTGEPYFDAHVVKVTKIAQAHLDRPDVVPFVWATCGALLHDVLEDVTPLNLDYQPGRIRAEFGEEVYQIVIGLTDVFTSERFPELNRAKRKAMEAGRLHVAGPEHLRWLIHTVKAADLIQNTEDIVQNAPDFAKTYLAEKRDILTILTSARLSIMRVARAQVFSPHHTTT